MPFSKNKRAKYRPHPIVMQLVILTQMDPRTHEELFLADGIRRETTLAWEKGTKSPTIDYLALRFETLGYKIMIGSVDAGLNKPK